MSDLKPFTQYDCPSCASSHWTGAYLNPHEDDGWCRCGTLLQERVSDGHRYRIEFETINPHEAVMMEAQYGRDVWGNLTDEEWDALAWYPVSREDDYERSIRDQYHNLSVWAALRQQPIRNVRMFRSAAAAWEPVL